MNHTVDLHIHSLSSGHAYSTIEENARRAAEIGLKMIAITDHSFAMPGGPQWIHFAALTMLPRNLYGVEILRGIEANILDYQGGLDVEKPWIDKLDVGIASYHDLVINATNRLQHTEGMLAVMEHPFVDIIGHPGNPAFELDIPAFVKGARDHNKLIEINNSSFKGTRKGSYDNCLEIAREAVKQGVGLVLSSDAHVSVKVGQLNQSQGLIEAAGVPEELIISRSPQAIKQYLYSKGKALDMKKSS